MKKILALIVMAAFLVTAALCFAQAPPAPPAKANKPGIEVPAWEANSVDSKDVIKSDKMKGKPYAIIFVNSSCSACRQELDEITNRNFDDNLAVIVAAVDVKPERILSTYREQLKITYPIVDDSKLALAMKFGIGFTPASVVVGRDGKVEAWNAGFTAANSAEVMKTFDKYVKK